MKLLTSFSLLLTYFLTTEALNCWVCDNARSNEACMQQGRLKQCQFNQQACQNEVRRGSFGTLITKRCKQAHACDNNFIQNPRAAWSPSQCNARTPSSVCRCCCNFDACNAPILGCLERAEPEPPVNINPPTCSAISTPEFGSKDCTSDRRKVTSNQVDVGTVCTFRCNPAYDLVGASTSTCEQNRRTRTARFSNPPPTCRRKRCINRQVPPVNGDVSCTQDNLVLSRCTFSCDAGYTLRGSNTLRCRSTRFWTQVPPICVRASCIPPHINPANGLVTCDNSNNLGSNCGFQCNNGFSLVGVPLSSCVIDVTSPTQGVWTSEAPTCQPIVCLPRLSTPSSGTMTCSNDNFLGSTCTFECLGSLDLIGERVSTCVDDGDGDRFGVWTAPPPSCNEAIIILCPQQEAPVNGGFACSDGEEVQSICEFQCRDGYELVGTPSNVCENSASDANVGVWSSDAPTCEPIFCLPAHAAPDSGSVSCSNANFAGSDCTFDCDAGFALVGTETSTCQNSGVWSSPPAMCRPIFCLPAHVAPDSGSVSCSNANFAGSDCTFDCDAGFALVGTETSTCQNSGVWSSPPAMCRPIFCLPAHVAPDSGSVSCSNANFAGSDCTFDCDAGFALVGTDTSRCQNSGVWSSPPAVCRPIVCVPPISRLANGDVSCDNANNAGSLCTFTCNDGFDLLGLSNVACTLVGVWSGPFPTCERKRCGPSPAANENSFKSCSEGDFLGSRCEYSCIEGYSREGARYSTCIEQNGGLLDWDNDAPRCTLIRCEDLEEINDGEITCVGDGLVDSVCSYTCNEDQGFTLYPPDVTRSVCLNDSSWDLPTPCCARECPPYAVMDLVIVMDSSSSIGFRNWEIMKSFVRSIIDSFFISSSVSRVSVFRYNNLVDTNSQILLNAFPDDKEGLLRAFDAIPYNGRGTLTGQGISHVTSDILREENGDRLDVRDVVIVITDGRSQDEVTVPSRLLREHGALTYAIGVVPPRGSLDRQQLLDIAGSEDSLLIAESGFAGLDDAFSVRLSEEICGNRCIDNYNRLNLEGSGAALPPQGGNVEISPPEGK